MAAGPAVEADLADLSSLEETAAFAARFAEDHDRLDLLVLNAGALTHRYTVTGEGNELTFATQVLHRSCSSVRWCLSSRRRHRRA